MSGLSTLTTGIAPGNTPEEGALRRCALSREAFQHLLDLLPTMIWWSSPDGREVFFNRAWIEFTGISPRSDRLFSQNALIHKEDRERAQGAWVRALVTGSPYRIEYRLRHRDGGHRWVAVKARAERNEAGAVVGWFGEFSELAAPACPDEGALPCCRNPDKIIESIPHKLWIASPDGQIAALNERWAQAHGKPGNDEVPQWWYAVHPDDRDAVLDAWGESVRTGREHELELRLKRPDGRYSWSILRVRPERAPDGSILRWYGSAINIDQWVADREALQSREALVREVVENCPDAIQLLDQDGRFIFINQNAAHAYGVADPAELTGTSWVDRFVPEQREEARRLLDAARAGERATLLTLASGRWWEIEAVPVCREDRDQGRILILAREVTERKETEERILWAAQHDLVTGLPNRGLLQQFLDAHLKEGERTGRRFSLFLLDLDHFKQTNDSLGHDAGDALLREFSRRLVAALGPTDFVARFGGDEFAVLCHAAHDLEQTTRIGEAILKSVSAPFSYGESLIDCQVSIGASHYPLHGEDSCELLKSADMALYGAKREGRGMLRLFQPEYRQDLQRRTSMLDLARAALKEERVIPFYQPKVSLRTGELCGFEALLRWRHPSAGLRSPDEIKAAFQDQNLACALSDRMIDQVLRDISRWRDRGLAWRHVAINAAAAEFRSGRFAERLLDRLHAAALPTSAIQLEVTETVFLGRGAECVEQALKLLSREGVLIALDDFGTGYASLSHLKQFPVDIIKIDRSFIAGLHSDPDDGAIVAAVINLARSLNIRVVAEGIETEAQHNTLLALGCDFGQGFLYGHPAEPDVAAERMTSN